jgi:hypothetical protein
MESMLAEDEEKKPKGEEPNDDDDNAEIEDESFFKKYKGRFIAGGIAAGILLIFILFMVFKPKPEPEVIEAAPPPPVTNDPWLERQQELYDAGIGAHYVDEAKIYEQGNLESFNFRQDFQQVDQPETFALPIKIDTAKDNMTYTKHRAVTAAGVEVYWLEGTFRERRIVSTISYALYQVLPQSGVVAIEVEVVTDANGSITITYVNPLPPAALQGGN